MPRQAEERVDWKSEYGVLMRRLGRDPFSDEVNRKAPRIRLNPPEMVILVHLESLTGVLCDLSAGGAAFYLNVPLTVGRAINLSFDKRYRFRVQVVSSTLDDHTVSGFRDTYRNGTRFTEDGDGYRCIVQSLQILSQAFHL